MSRFAGIKKGDIVRVKFIEMRDLVGVKGTTKSRKSYQLVGEWELGANILAFTYGGDFLVKKDFPDNAGPKETLELLNHLDGGEFDIAQEIVATIDVVDAAHKFVSEDHKLCMIMTDSELLINGEKIINTDDDKHLDLFVQFVERYLTSKAINDSLKKDR
jgi:hypothetical protein